MFCGFAEEVKTAQMKLNAMSSTEDEDEPLLFCPRRRPQSWFHTFDDVDARATPRLAFVCSTELAPNGLRVAAGAPTTTSPNVLSSRTNGSPSMPSCSIHHDDTSEKKETSTL